ncbi:mycobacterial-type methylenetetrahydrofolate reductase [Rhodococcus sp. IEGM 1379]|uniref:mycobacterial-type methylenetetrahydrofolate reductase n=1 Tax=Rhodococcus sp. IEGM 1379 TaxID=3047086 RepID=UPI0024B68073|nr:mycobacterial-type methylenetetrahydrofolate reductase [Rhodococcus sp. IEGM 1379]MDI9915033.1 mycobacterial-type methylenetetrahydrofolate reductase [Rhodococcus sp. IEGM 1379]
MNTVALELVPPELQAGAGRAIEESRTAAEQCCRYGLAEHVGHVMIPGIIAEGEDRPVELTSRMDVLDFWEIIRPSIGTIAGLCTQVTVFLDVEQLATRVQRLRDVGLDGITFVGKPQGLAAVEAPGASPGEAVTRCRSLIPHRGVVLIPTRRGELGRFASKCEHGATFALTQLLYSERIVGFLREFTMRSEHRPEILLSFGYLPGMEQRVRLIDWLIHDERNELVRQEQEFVACAASSSQGKRRRDLVDLYRRVVDGVHDLGFPLSVHLEAPYGVSGPACETFAAMLDHWSPR